MDIQALKLPWGRPLTRDDLRPRSRDGRLYELVDGLLVASPAPTFAHQYAVGNLLVALMTVCPRELEVVLGPVSLALGDDSEIHPDLVVIDREPKTATASTHDARLTIEVSSPSTRVYDLLLKKDRLERAGCQHYWVVDPDIPAITAWTLHDGIYVESAHATGDQEFQVTDPFPVTLTPAALTAD